MTTWIEVRLAGHALRPIMAVLSDCPVPTVGGQVAALIRHAEICNKGTGTMARFEVALHEAEFLAVTIDDLLDGDLRGTVTALGGDERRHARRALREALERIERALV